jgi:SAM-dependent methyltransferase
MSTHLIDAPPSEYTNQFYTGQCEGSLRSAREIVPLVVSLTRPRSVVDVGCGIGTWVKMFQDNGIPDVMGVDGAYVHRDRLLICQDRFLAVDLRKPFRMSRQFDLAVCLEVAEHLPECCAETFVESLVALGPLVLFSAAIPYQGGTHHVNEQWPEYWAARFLKHDYVPVDCIRRRIWNHPDVEPWYAQNTLLFVKRPELDHYPSLQTDFRSTLPDRLAMIHPDVYMQWADPVRRHPRYASLGKVLAAVPYALRKALRAKLGLKAE